MSTAPIHERIRSRRRDQGLRGYELAEKADISPSYVTLIEKGLKVPDEDVAARIAKVLGDDEDLYRAWARSARYGDLEHLPHLQALRRFSSDPELRRRLASGESYARLSPQEDLQEEPRPAALVAEPASGGAVPVVVLREGQDPEAEPPGPDASVIHLDHSLLGAPQEELFAYRVGRGDMAHLRGRASPGDLVVLRRGVRRLAPERICAVRMGGRVVLARVLVKPNALLLLPAEGGQSFDTIDVDGPDAVSRAIVGVSVLVVRL